MPASAIFDTHAEAERAVHDLRSLGVRDSQISVIAHHGNTTTTHSGDGEVTDEQHRSVLRGILGGGALGAGLGVAVLAIPGIGPLAATGAIAAAAVPEALGVGAALGAIGGSLNEVLTKHGVDENDARYYDSRLKNGAVLVTVDDNFADGSEVRNVLHRSGGHNAASPRAMA